MHIVLRDSKMLGEHGADLFIGFPILRFRTDGYAQSPIIEPCDTRCLRADVDVNTEIHKRTIHLADTVGHSMI